MVRPREFDEEKALDAAMQLFWEKGYEASSLSDLTARMGIQRPSIYSAFGDKLQLFEAALRRYSALHAARVRAYFHGKSPVRETFRLFFEDLAAAEYEGGSNRGCLCIHTMVELAPHDEKFEILTREHQMYLAAIFQEAVERGVQSGELKTEMHPKALAQTLVVSMIGLTVMLKSRPERSFADHTVAGIVSLVR
jgi:TetR/AcrR family transcriptional regulator, transcriptional repressor for nem operon